MKHTDALWLQNVANRLNHSSTKSNSFQNIPQSVNLFLEELCTLMEEYSYYFNELTNATHPEFSCRVFRLGSPRPGMMLLRGKDKLVISSENLRIKTRVVQIQAYNETNVDVMEFEPKASIDGDVYWVCANNGHNVNPELVARAFLGPFFARGSQAYGIKPERTDVNLSGSPAREL